MEERNVTVDRDNAGSLAAFSLVAVLVVVALIGLFVWQPWTSSTTTQRSANQTVTQPGTNGTTGSSGTTTNGSSTTTSGGSQ
jgi:predicted negative regulator of RcsB-dependent stress response